MESKKKKIPQQFQFNFFSGVSYLEKLLFTKHLALMLKSGITAVDAIDTLVHQTKSSVFQRVLSSILADLENGLTLAATLGKHPKVFDQLYVGLIDVGEQSGNLDKNLEYLAKQLTKEYNLRRKVQGVMFYPAIVMSAAVIIGAFISYFIFPQLINFFHSLNVKLPLTTQVLLFIAETSKNYGIYILIALAILVILLRLLLQVPSIKKIWHRLVLTLPVFGHFFQISHLASFSRNFGVMLKSGLTITSTLEILAKSMDNLIYKEYIVRMHKAVIRGKTISQELESNFYSFIPPTVTKMISIGEKTGRLDETLLFLGDFFEEEVDDMSSNLSSLLEPILLIGIALMVGFLALAIISPIYQLTGSIKNNR